MTELHPFVRLKAIESAELILKKKTVIVFWRFQSKITKQRCIFSSYSFLNNNYYIIYHNIYIFFIFIKNKNKNANKQ